MYRFLDIAAKFFVAVVGILGVSILVILITVVLADVGWIEISNGDILCCTNDFIGTVLGL